MDKEFKSGFIAVVGPTNSGKSTLVNALVGHKVSIVSPKVQTTYHGIRGILNTPTEQMVFTDTPGFQRFSEQVARLLNRVAERQAIDADILVWVFDASNPRPLAAFEKLKPKIQSLKGPEKSICVLNKVDQVRKENVLPLIQTLHATGLFSDIVPLSALKHDNLTRLLDLIREKMVVGQPYFPVDSYTDRSQNFQFAELVREKIYEATQKEIPYSVWVEMENFEADAPEPAPRVPTIRAVIHVDGASRKPILIGKQGEMLKRIGTLARKEIENLVGKQVCLKLHVDVERGWRDSAVKLHQYLELDR